MKVVLRKYESSDCFMACKIWNQVVEDGRAFPQEQIMQEQEADLFFQEQTYTGVAIDSEKEEVVGLYILHPNNVGRCGHISNASYAVRRDVRGQKIGEKLVKDCLHMARQEGFKILQFNAVVASNEQALRLYKKLGFIPLGVIPGGFRLGDGTYEDIIPHYICL